MPNIAIVPRLIQIAFLLFVAVGSYLYFSFQARPFTPALDKTFFREPVLTGEYRYEVLEGRRNHRTLVGNTEISCGTFSYYAGTIGQSDGYSNCGDREELRGKLVEVHRVRVPQKNEAVDPLVVKILSDGKVFLDRTDADVRELWIRNTEGDVLSKTWKLTLLLFVVSWPLFNRLSKRTNGNVK